jgi:CBS domain-containing protein
MRIADICSHRVICIAPEATVQHAAELMQQHDVGALVVAHSGKRVPIGILTDRDIITNVIGQRRDTHSVTVSDVMATSLATCRDNHELFDVLELMHQRGIRRVPVVDGHSALVGIVTTDDLIGALAEHVLVLARSVLGEDTIERRRFRDENVGERELRRAEVVGRTLA